MGYADQVTRVLDGLNIHYQVRRAGKQGGRAGVMGLLAGSC